jgi:hypothetical protein
MRTKHVYLVLCVVGTVVPYYAFVPFLREHGLDLRLLLEQLFATRVSTFFALDVVISAVVLFVLIWTERRRGAVKHLWAPVLATVTVGVSLGLPLLLYLRERAAER